MAPWLCCGFCGNPKQVGDRSTSTSSSSYTSDADQPTKFMKYKNHRRTPSSANSAASANAANSAVSGPQRSPVWQRSIIMGERCKRPNFSGLILYDEKGNPLPLNKSARPAVASGVSGVPPPRK